MKLTMSALMFFVSLFFSLTRVFAAPSPLPLQHQVHLSEFKGRTFLQAMMDPNRGIKKELDADYSESYQMADWESVASALQNFDNKNVQRVLNSFENGPEGLKSLVQSLQGQSMSPTTAFSLVRGKIKAGGDPFAVAQLLAIASRAGTLVVLDSQNYYYNYGYKSGAQPEDDVKSGRSFGAGPLHSAIDASDVYYLNELEKYLQQADDLKPFYEALLKILLQCDTSGLQTLSPLGQTVLTDFIAIYTAETDRHLMVALNPSIHPWENDLAGSTFVSAFGAKVGKIMKAGKLQPAPTRDWWAMSSSGSGRSGIGITRQDRMKLQRLLSDFVRSQQSPLVEKIEASLGRRSDGDVFQALMETLNSFEGQEKISQESSTLLESFTGVLTEIHNQAPLIETHVMQLQ